MRRGRSRRATALAAAFGVVFAAALALAPATGASAHDFLVDSTPAVNSTVTTPLTSVSLTFNDLVLDLSGDGASSVVEVTGPDGASTHFETGCPTILGRTISAPVTLGAPGKYQVSWQIVSSDGHPVSNALDFTYAPATGASDTATTPASVGSPNGPDCGGSASSTGVAALPATSSPDASGTGINAGLILGIAGGIVLLAIVGVVLVLVLSRRSGAPHDDGDEPGDAIDSNPKK